MNKPVIQKGNNIYLSPEIESVLQVMFGRFSRIVVEDEYGRGYSNSRVFRVVPVRREGQAQRSAVVKIAPIGLIFEEWHAYETWVKDILPGIARIEGEPTLSPSGLWGGLRYDLVGNGAFNIQSFHEYIESGDLSDVIWLMEERLFPLLGRYWWWDNKTNRTFQMQADYDLILPVNLRLKLLRKPPDNLPVQTIEPDTVTHTEIAVGDYVCLQNFIVSRVDLDRRQLRLDIPGSREEERSAAYRVTLIDIPDVAQYQVGQALADQYGVVVATRHSLLAAEVQQAFGDDIDLSVDAFALPNSLSLPNPLLLYQDILLNTFLTVNLSTIHSDLNFENILVDPATRDVSLIDFATVRVGHVLHDLLRLETEVLIKHIAPILVDVGLSAEAIYPFYEQLHEVMAKQKDRQPVPKLPHMALEVPFKLLVTIRRMARKSLFNGDDWTEYYHGLTLYLLGALKFSSLDEYPTAPLPKQVVFWGAASAQQLLNTDQYDLDVGTLSLESPQGTMHPNSKFYVERTADAIWKDRLAQKTSVTLFIQAPRQMGKSSLMRRAIEYAKTVHHKPYAFIDFQKFPEHYYHDEEAFLIEFCLMIGDAFGIPEAVDQYWQGRRTNIMKCSRYLSDYIIPNVDTPFILAMDEVERMLVSSFHANFFGMLRTWHNDRVFDDHMAKMSLFLSSSTEPYLFIDNPSQSPFNVAELILLQDFSLAEVEVINRQHNLPLNYSQVRQLMDLVSGHPFLTRSAIYQIAAERTDFPTLISQATDDHGPFGDHLRHYLLRVLQQTDLREALIYICKNADYEEDQVFHRLKGAGLIKKSGKQIVLRNRLYERYFKEHLNV